mgnify:CR=1 FL=1
MEKYWLTIGKLLLQLIHFIQKKLIHVEAINRKTTLTPSEGTHLYLS